MNRSLLVLLALCLTLAVPVPLGDAQATAPPLVADAGDSKLLTTETSTGVSVLVRGGVAPYTVAWSIGGDASAFADATAASTTLDVAALGAGLHTLTVDVTDDVGTTTSDAVVYAIAAPLHVASHTETRGPGAPDELVGAGGLDGASATHTFTVPSGVVRLDAELSWTDPSNDLDLALFDPSDASATGTTGQTSAHPERVSVDTPAAGTWTAAVDSFLSTGETFTFTATGYLAPPLPVVRHNGPYLFGALDVQQLAGEVEGLAPSSAWDLDGDGVFETAGAAPVVALAGGVHDVKVRVLDTATGLRATKAATIEVRGDLDHVLALGCTSAPSRPFKPMELSAGGGVCWHHGGHHTYFLGEHGKAWTLAGGTGRIVSVEQLFSPPGEYVTPPLTTPVVLETSLDGQSWTTVHVVPYALVSTNQRQALTFTLGDSDEPFRYLRIHQPRSLAQGLSGFLDASRIELFTEAAPFTAPTLLGDQTRTFRCEYGDLLEDLFAEHPCWFGGVNRYDSPSFFHTYALGDGASVTQLAGTFTVAPWRTDDWFRPITTDPSDVTTTHVHLQASPDGMAWTDLATIEADHGVPTTFDVEVDATATFVRLLPEGHRLFDEYRAEPSLHHPEAFLVHSAITVTGDLAPSGPACEANPDATELGPVYLLVGEPLGAFWIYAESNGHPGLQTGATHISGSYSHSPDRPEQCASADTLLL